MFQETMIEETFQFGDHTVTLETGRIARQADAAVMVSMGDMRLLVTVVGAKKADPTRDFFGLTVIYQERMYSAGRIPGGFFKREARPTADETLTARLIDRAIRPMFEKGFKNEVQVVVTLLSLDPNVMADIPAMIGTSAALTLSGLPFPAPISCARVGYQNDEFVLNPSAKALTESSLDLIVAGTKSSVVMVESEAKELSEAVMLDALMFGHEQMQVAIDAIAAMAKKANVQSWDWRPEPVDTDLIEKVTAQAGDDIAKAYQIVEKQARQKALAAVYERVSAAFDEDTDASKIAGVLKKLEASTVRSKILNGEPRIDGRDTETVRPISIETGVLPRAHGSALFTRGETQALVVSTIGTARDSQVIDAAAGESKDSFMLHYNFPPYCVGEMGMMGSPKRREIGHGRLAKRAITPMLPGEEDYPYVLRVVSEITESNGSSSMASVCGASLALMDASVPLKAPVAGIAMGLIKDDDCFAVLTDILGDEDHLGDMDFKVAGTDSGITALQMDIKIDGITHDIMEVALNQAKDGRLHILSLMNAKMPGPKQEMSQYAPRMMTLKVKADKIRDVIGKGGAMIRELTETYNASIDINDEGLIAIVATDDASVQALKTRIEDLTAEVEVGKVYEGKVARLVDFGAFVTVLPGKDGLLHISQIKHERVENVTDELSEGQMVKVKVLEIDKQGRVRLSAKALLDMPNDEPAE